MRVLVIWELSRNSRHWLTERGSYYFALQRLLQIHCDAYTELNIWSHAQSSYHMWILFFVFLRNRIDVFQLKSLNSEFRIKCFRFRIRAGRKCWFSVCQGIHRYDTVPGVGSTRWEVSTSKQDKGTIDSCPLNCVGSSKGAIRERFSDWNLIMTTFEIFG